MTILGPSNLFTYKKNGWDQYNELSAKTLFLFKLQYMNNKSTEQQIQKAKNMKNQL